MEYQIIDEKIPKENSVTVFTWNLRLTINENKRIEKDFSSALFFF